MQVYLDHDVWRSNPISYLARDLALKNVYIWNRVNIISGINDIFQIFDSLSDWLKQHNGTIRKYLKKLT